MHQRRIIRNGFADRIRDAQTTAGDRVFAGREAPADVEDLIAEGPVVLVYTRKDHAKREDYSVSGFDGGVKRTLEVLVEITVTGAWTVDDKLDDLAEEIEALFEAWEPEGLPATEIRLISTEIDSTEAFQQPVGGALLVFETEYWRAWRTDNDQPACARELRVSINGGAPELLAECDDATVFPVFPS